MTDDSSAMLSEVQACEELERNAPSIPDGYIVFVTSNTGGVEAMRHIGDTWERAPEWDDSWQS